MHVFLFFSKKHARRVYEILRLRETDMSDEQKAKDYCTEVKKRLFGPYRVSFGNITRAQNRPTRTE